MTETRKKAFKKYITSDYGRDIKAHPVEALVGALIIAIPYVVIRKIKDHRR